MGLFDSFNFDDPATMGLLSAGLNMIGNSGRGTNMSTGAILANGVGSGFQGAQGVLDSRTNAELLKRKLAMEDLQNQHLQMGVDAQKLAMEDSALQRKTLMEYAANKRISPQPQAAQAPSMQNQSFVPQPQSVGESLMQGSTPQMSIGQPQDQPQSQSQAQPSSKSSMIQQQIDKLYNQADYFDSKGVQGGDIYRAKAIELEKLKPKFSTEYRVGKDAQGNMVNMRLADDGTEQASPYGVAEKLNWSNNGGVTTGNDAYTGKTVRSITNSQSPDSVASQDTIRRGQDLNNQETAIPAGQIENVAKMIASGNLAPLSPKMAMSPQGLAVMAKVAELNPAYSGKDYGTSSKAEKDFSTGKQGNSVRSFNVALSHLDTLGNLADAMGNKDTQALNKIGNYFATQTGQAAPTNFEAAKKVVADEVVKAIVGSGGGLADREEAARSISAASSPAQLKGVIATYKELMKGQLNGLKDQYKSTTGKDDFEAKYLSENARNTMGHGEQQKGKVASLQDIADTAKASGKTTAEVTAKMKSMGYTIGSN
jgi:hypothetical protein